MGKEMKGVDRKKADGFVPPGRARRRMGARLDLEWTGGSKGGGGGTCAGATRGREGGNGRGGAGKKDCGEEH